MILHRMTGAGRVRRLLRPLLLCVLLAAFLALGALLPAVGLAEKDAQSSTRISIAAIGDLLIHQSVYQSAYDSKTGLYDFRPIFKYIAPYLGGADYTIANLETRFAGPELGYSGYPRFNCPASLGTAVREAGVDLLATANNHSLDMGWTGIVNTLDNIDRIGLAHIGTSRSEAERAQIFMRDIRGVRVAFLNYTESTNGIPLPSGRPYAVNLMDESRLLAEARSAKANGADLVVAVLHWGVEYQRTPASYQRDLASRLLRGGVDVIVGSHPHVVQPIERLSVSTASGSKTGYVVYSLGNFVSNQRAPDYPYGDNGIIVYLDVEKTANGTKVVGVRYLPVWVQKSYATGRAQFRVLPVSPEISRVSDLGLSSDEKARMDWVWRELHAHLLRSDQNVLPYGASERYQAALQDVVARKIMEGYGNGSLGAGDPVTRQQFAKLICLTMGLKVTEADVCRFTDVSKSGPSSLYPDNYVAKAESLGIIKGTGPTTFSPGSYISRGQVITMVVRALDRIFPGILKSPPSGFISTWSTGFSPEHGPNARKAE